jgi:hypothetical protein
MTDIPLAERKKLRAKFETLGQNDGECSWCGWPYVNGLHESDCIGAIAANLPKGEDLDDSYRKRSTRVGFVMPVLLDRIDELEQQNTALAAKIEAVRMLVIETDQKYLADTEPMSQIYENFSERVLAALGD